MPQLITRSQRSFARGMNDNSEVDEYRPDEVAVLYNARVTFDGDAARRRGGSTRQHATALNSGAQIHGATEFYDASGNRMIVVVAGTKAYKSTNDGETWTELATGLTGAGWDFTVMQSGADRLLIGVNGNGPPQKFDGTTWSDLTGTSIPDDAIVCEYHNNRLWLWGHDGSHILQGSKVDTPTDFSSGAGGVTVRVEITQGDPTPRGLWSLGSALLVFTWEQVGYVEGFGINTVQVLTGHRGLSRSLGCVSHRTIAPIGETGMIWLSRLGFVYMEQGSPPQLISDQIQPFIDELAWDNIAADSNLPTSAYYPRRHEYHCAVPGKGNSQNTHTVVIRPRRLGRPLAIWIYRQDQASGLKFEIEDGLLELSADGNQDGTITAGVFDLMAIGLAGTQGDIIDGVLELATNNFVASALFTANDDDRTGASELWSGAYDGFVRRLEQGDKDDVLSDGSGGSAISAWIRTRPETYGDQFRRARTRSARVSVKAATGGSLDVYAVGDGVAGTKKTKTLTTQDKTQVPRYRVTAKGYALQLDLKFTDDLTIQAAETAAEILRESP